MLSTDLTVAAIVERDDRYLIVEEIAHGRAVLSQPGGHIEKGESPEAAVVREVLEETGCIVSAGQLVGTYLWIHPQTRRQYLRLMYAAEYLECDESLPLDDVVIARHWMSRDELQGERARLRSPVVLRAVRDYEAGRRESARLLAGLLPLEDNVQRVIARAELI